jgi:hypothetical protein
MSVLVKISAAAPTPMLHRKAAEAFERLRRVVRDGAGFDFLAKLGDALRPANFVSDKDGVANRSWHKTGRAFDYDQTSSRLVLVSEPKGGKQYFRTYLVCTDQTGKLGVKRSLRDIRGGSVNAYVFDFTAAAEKLGFKRIPAWNGWQRNYNRREFWHYQFDEGLTWAEAMAELEIAAKPKGKTYGVNDRGPQVRKIQKRLYELGFLPKEEIDGDFGEKTLKAVKAFQTTQQIEVDGLVGDTTFDRLKA